MRFALDHLAAATACGTLAVLCAVSLFGGCAGGDAMGAHAGHAQVAAPSESTAIAAAIHRAWNEHIAAAQRKDLAGVVALYSADAVFVVSPDSVVSGHAALRAFEAQGLEQGEVIHATHTTHSLRICADEAYELGTICGPVRPRGGAVQVVTWNYCALWCRGSDGQWRIARLAGK